MGFFGKIAAAGKARFTVEMTEAEYNKYLANSPNAEPYEFMVNSWDAMFTGAGKDLIATCATEIVKIYGCMPSPICVRMMAYHSCHLLMPDFHRTQIAREWYIGMQELWQMEATFEAERLNSLFKGYNPKSYGAFIAEWRKPPFDKKSMQENEQRWQRLKLP